MGEVKAITAGDGFALDLDTEEGLIRLSADRLVNAAGPFAGAIASMLGVDLPIFNTLQQKIAFEDRSKAIPRNMPFSIDLDRQFISWSDDERELLLEDPDVRRFAEEMPGAVHCRPDGGDNGTWVKLGWAYNEAPSTPSWEPPFDDSFPEIVLRGASRLNPSLEVYHGRLPRNMHHYGGWYTMTAENWPLIGRMGVDGAFMNCAHSGFGTMAACAAGELCGAWIAGAPLPAYGHGFSLARYDDAEMMKRLGESNRGVL